jgi:hypothetical protein
MAWQEGIFGADEVKLAAGAGVISFNSAEEIRRCGRVIRV